MFPKGNPWLICKFPQALSCFPNFPLGQSFWGGLRWLSAFLWLPFFPQSTWEASAPSLNLSWSYSPGIHHPLPCSGACEETLVLLLFLLSESDSSPVKYPCWRSLSCFPSSVPATSCPFPHLLMPVTLGTHFELFHPFTSLLQEHHQSITS